MSDTSHERNPYELHPGEIPYLKCTYGEGMHPSERVVSFTTTDAKSNENPLLVRVEGKRCIDPHPGFLNHAIVSKERVIPLEGNKGLIGIFDIFSDDGNNSLIRIPDNDNGGDSRKYVPNSEIVWR